MAWRDSKIAKLRRLAALSAFEWVSLVFAVLMLPGLALALRLFGTRRTLRYLARHSFPGVGGEDPGTYESVCVVLSRVVRIAAAHGPYKASCLDRSLLLWWLLGRRGFPASLWFGVRKQGPDLQAHAWVEYCGTVLNDVLNVAETYSPIYCVKADTVSEIF